MRTCHKKQLKVSSIQAGSLPLGGYFLYKRDEESLSAEKRRIWTNESYHGFNVEKESA